MSTLDRAIEIAVAGHRHQLDKGGHPYILHPLRVMLAVESTTDRIVAVLHDVLEDTHIDMPYLVYQGFSIEVQQALDCLTRRPDEDYKKFILRCSFNEIARRVKMADLQDNMDLRRIANPTEVDRRRSARYYNSLVMLRQYRP